MKLFSLFLLLILFGCSKVELPCFQIIGLDILELSVSFDSAESWTAVQAGDLQDIDSLFSQNFSLNQQFKNDSLTAMVTVTMTVTVTINDRVFEFEVNKIGENIQYVNDANGGLFSIIAVTNGALARVIFTANEKCGDDLFNSVFYMIPTSKIQDGCTPVLDFDAADFFQN